MVLLGCCLVSPHFLCDIAVQRRARTDARCTFGASLPSPSPHLILKKCNESPFFVPPLSLLIPVVARTQCYRSGGEQAAYFPSIHSIRSAKRRRRRVRAAAGTGNRRRSRNRHRLPNLRLKTTPRPVRAQRIRRRRGPITVYKTLFAE